MSRLCSCTRAPRGANSNTGLQLHSFQLRGEGEEAPRCTRGRGARHFDHARLIHSPHSALELTRCACA
jgi:hypothetical protein